MNQKNNSNLFNKIAQLREKAERIKVKLKSNRK